jgi:hypothetical protein
MSTESQDFEKLRKLLALKRYELPPPRFFAEFPGRVMRKLEAAQEAASRPWWSRLWLELEFKPAFACVAGLLVCGALVAGIAASERLQGYAIQGVASGEDANPEAVLVASVMGSPKLASGLRRIDRSEDIPSSTAPVGSMSTAFTTFQQSGVRPLRAGFSF